MHKVPPLLVCVLTGILALNVGCSRKPDDAKISSDIQNKFNQDSGLSTKQLGVEASSGVVTLTGSVDNDAQRMAAAKQAASVKGVKEVINDLQVSSAANAAPPPSVPPVEVAHNTPPADRKPRIKTSRRRNTSQSDDHEAAPSESGDDSPPPSSPAQADPVAAAVPPPAPPAPPQPEKVTIEQGSQVSIRLIDSLDSEKNQVGDTFHASLNAPLMAEGAEAIPAGADVSGHVVDVKSAGKFAGKSVVVLQLDRVTANGRTYDLPTDQYRKEGASRGKNTAEKVGGGAIVGGIIGAIAGGGKGAAIGSAAGAGVGGGVQAAGKSQQIKLPSETVLNFTLQTPVTVLRSLDPNAGRQKLGDSQ